MGKLTDLVAQLDRRKAAMLGLKEDDGVTMVVSTGLEGMLPLLAGTDIDPDELVESAQAIAAATLAALMAGRDAQTSIMSVWVDGLATGLQDHAPGPSEPFLAPTGVLQDAWVRLTVALLTGALAVGDLPSAQAAMRATVDEYPVRELADEHPSSVELSNVAGLHAQRALALLQEALGGA